MRSDSRRTLGVPCEDTSRALARRWGGMSRGWVGLVTLLALTALAPAPALADGGIYALGGVGLGGGNFAGIDDFETGWGLFGDAGMVITDGDIGFLASVLLTYLRTSDGTGDQRVVTVGNFYGATVGGGFGDDGALVFARVGAGFGTVGQDTTPDGEYQAVTRDRGFAAMGGLGFVLAAGDEGVSMEIGLDWVQIFANGGTGYAIGYVGMGVAFGN